MSGEEGDPREVFRQRQPENMLEQTDFIDEEDLDEQAPVHVQEVEEVILNLISVGKFTSQFNNINCRTKECI